MSITKESIIDQITITKNGTVLYRTATHIIDGDTKISETYHRSSLVPGQDLTRVPENVQAICAVAWTPEVISVYQSSTEVRSN